MYVIVLCLHHSYEIYDLHTQYVWYCTIKKQNTRKELCQQTKLQDGCELEGASKGSAGRRDE